MDQLEKGNAKKIKKKPQKMFLQKKERKRQRFSSTGHKFCS